MEFLCDLCNDRPKFFLYTEILEHYHIHHEKEIPKESIERINSTSDKIGFTNSKTFQSDYNVVKPTKDLQDAQQLDTDKKDVYY